MQARRDGAIAHAGFGRGREHPLPAEPVADVNLVLGPVADPIERRPKVDHTTRRDVVFHVQEVIELVTDGQIDSGRADRAVGSDPDGPAIRPLGVCASKRTEQQFQVIREPQIIMLCIGHDSAFGLTQNDIAIGVTAQRCFGQVEPGYPGIVEIANDVTRSVSASVADDQQFQVGHGLRQYGSDRIAQHVGAVVGRQ